MKWSPTMVFLFFFFFTSIQFAYFVQITLKDLSIGFSIILFHLFTNSGFK